MPDEKRPRGFRSERRATRPDVLFEEEEDEDDGTCDGRGAFEKEKDEKFLRADVEMKTNRGKTAASRTRRFRSHRMDTVTRLRSIDGEMDIYATARRERRERPVVAERRCTIRSSNNGDEENNATMRWRKSVI